MINAEGAWAAALEANGPVVASAGRIAVTIRPSESYDVIGANRSRLADTEVAALSIANGATIWRKKGLPPVALADAGGVVAYGRGGLAVRLTWDGREVWRALVPDDRSASGRQRGDGDSPFAATVAAHDGHTYLPAGDTVVAVAPDGSQQPRRVCTDARGVILSLVGTDDGGLIVVCGARSDYDDETRGWDGPTHETHPTYATARIGPEHLVRLRPDGTVVWSHEIATGTNGWRVAAKGGLVVYSTPSGTAAPARAEAINDADDSVAWSRDLSYGGRNVIATPAGFLVGAQMFDARGSVVWTNDLPIATVAGDRGFAAGSRAIVILDLLKGGLTSRIPLAPLAGDVLIRAATPAWVVASVVGGQTVLVGVPY